MKRKGKISKRESSGFLYISHSKKLITATDFKKPQTISRRINDAGIIAACHCGAEYETKYSASIKTHTATSIDSGHQKSTDIPHEESVDSRPEEWENDYYNPTLDAYTRQHMHTEEYDENYEEERAIEYRATLDEEDKLLEKECTIVRHDKFAIDRHSTSTMMPKASIDRHCLLQIG
ncbi:hypothetical protein F2Q68_00038970 [Brassica cretica]|uniref:Uncharacterized protein n=2 Tax=Brassica cretica TaxID=69181 RepID=A0ABQ7ABW5_BRACR|nr:hypothetical protein F2Q68_00038970 [Brassica cretica]KAF3495189.1 hypothetical protein DY000_02052541 [Brassica cretica]